MAARAKWEWQVFGCQFRDLENELNQREAEGWEAVHILPGAKKGTCVAVFRRSAGDRPRTSESEPKTSRIRR